MTKISSIDKKYQLIQVREKNEQQENKKNGQEQKHKSLKKINEKSRSTNYSFDFSQSDYVNAEKEVLKSLSSDDENKKSNTEESINDLFDKRGIVFDRKA